MRKHEPDVWAFPTQTATEWLHGMSLRDYFAGQALQLDIVQRQTPHEKAMAEEAYRIADAMLEARKK